MYKSFADLKEKIKIELLVKHKKKFVAFIKNKFNAAMQLTETNRTNSK